MVVCLAFLLLVVKSVNISAGVGLNKVLLLENCTGRLHHCDVCHLGTKKIETIFEQLSCAADPPTRSPNIFFLVFRVLSFIIRPPRRVLAGTAKTIATTLFSRLTPRVP